MADKAKELLKKIQEWWNKFTSKQKTIIVAAVTVVVLAFTILFSVFSQTKYELLRVCDTTKEASEIVEMLEGEGIAHKETDDGLRIEVDAKQMSTASLLLGANGFTAAGYSIDNVTDGGFSSTESDKQKKYNRYLEERLENDFIGAISTIKNAYVTLNLPENDGTLISKNEEGYASIVLELDGEFTADNAAYLARAVATSIGNDSTDKVTIIDTEGNLLYSGENDYSVGGAATSQLSVKKQAEAHYATDVKKVLTATNEFTMIEVSPNLSIDFTERQTTTHNYSAPDGREEGMKASESLYESEEENASGGVPGTDSNTETTTMIQDSDSSTSTQSESNTNYLPNEEVTNEKSTPGEILADQSSIAVTGTQLIIVKEDDVRRQGLLDGVSWDEYKLANTERARVEVEEELYSVVSNATGIPRDNITIVKYTENYFIDSEGLGLGAWDIVQIILIVVILALLGFVVLRSMASKKEEVQEEELSVETLLQSAPASELENIDVEEKSETRKLIDRFVEENPEAAANLLRNWLNEDWG